jgi:hypothetical protein
MNIVANNTLLRANQLGMIVGRLLHCSLKATTIGGRLSPQLQNWLQHIRTDLDKFDDVEIDSLVDHGEQVALEKLAQAYGALPESGGSGLPRFGESELRILTKAGTRRWRLFDSEDWAAYVLVGLVLAVPISLYFLVPGS